MRKRYFSLIVALMAMLAFTIVLFAQRGQRTLRPPFVTDSNRPFDAHDLAGIWSRNSGGYGGGGTCFDCGDRGYAGGTRDEWPVFTPEGQKRFDANKPSYGRALGSAEAAAHPEEHIGRRRAVPPANDTDPYQHCNPEGTTRALIYPDPVEFIVLPDRIIQNFEWTYAWRTIWTDGRKLPKPEDVDIPRWWGYSVGHWEGDTFVVNSTGYDERTWVDHYGYPHSDQMQLEERYRRINYNTLELKMTITDPVVYAKPWASQTKRFHLIPKDGIQTADGWTGLLEDLCAPADEVDQFNRRIRDPAGGVIHEDEQ